MKPHLVALLLLVCVAGVAAQDGAACPVKSIRLEVLAAPSWKWVHAGVGFATMGNALDWATSWKQPEGNRYLTEQTGMYAGKFHRNGTAVKIGVAAAVAGASYLVAWKWPKSRKLVGILGMVVGAEFTVVAASNVVRNPYFR